MNPGLCGEISGCGHGKEAFQSRDWCAYTRRGVVSYAVCPGSCYRLEAMELMRKPRSYLAADFETMFGRIEEVGWRKESVRVAPSMLSASYRQHLLAFNLRRAMRAQRETQADLAKRVGMDTETLRRKVRGEYLISWEEASRLALAFPQQDIIPSGDLMLPRLLL